MVLDNLARDTRVARILGASLEGAHDLSICTGYLSVGGLRSLLGWLDDMNPSGHVRLLVGMPPSGWNGAGPHTEPADRFVRAHLAGHGLSSAVLEALLARVRTQLACGRLEIRCRTQAPHLHGKCYAWVDASGRRCCLMGSSNLSASGIGVQTGRVQGELNLMLGRDRQTSQVMDWFEDRWNDRNNCEWHPAARAGRTGNPGPRLPPGADAARSAFRSWAGMVLLTCGVFVGAGYWLQAMSP